MSTKALILIPTDLGGNVSVISSEVRAVVSQLDCFIVENLRSARRYLRSIGYKKNFDEEVTFFELDKHNLEEQKLFEFLMSNNKIGLMSEAGLPCIADPGALAVELAHQLKFQVTPLVGPSSIIMGLISSGMNGQQFTFHGYLPIESTERIKRIKQMESDAKRTGYTQLFMETPYRNEKLIELITKTCRPETLLCVACDISLESEFIQTRQVKNWKKDKPNFHKRPAIFALGR